MTSPEAPDSTAMLAMRVRTLQIIVGALVAGLLIIIAIMAFIASGQRPNNGGPQAAPSTPLITYVSYLFAVMLIPMSVVIPSQIVASARKGLVKKTPSDDVDALTNLYQTKTIISGAMREGVGHFAAITYMIEHQVMSLGLALACVVAEAALFPTRERVDRWIEDQLGRLAQEREFGT